MGNRGEYINRTLCETQDSSLMTMILPCDDFQGNTKKARQKGGGLMMKMGLPGSVWLQFLFLFESQTKGKGEGSIGKMYCSLLPSAKKKGRA